MKELYEKYLSLKEQEKEIVNERVCVEAEIYEKYQGQIEAKVKGSTSIEDGDFTLTVTRNLVRTFDQAALHRLNAEKSLPFKTEFKIGEKDIQDLDANLAADVLECSSTKYNKPTFKIERN